MIKVTLDEIRAVGPCKSGWAKGLAAAAGAAFNGEAVLKEMLR